MSKEIEDKLEKIPLVNILVKFGKKIKIPGLEGMSLYDVLEMYITGIIEGALTTRAGGIAFSFFMAIFPFMLFILTLIPYIPIDGFQEGLFSFIKSNTSLLLYFLFLMSNEHTIDVSLLEIGKNAIGPFFVKI